MVLLARARERQEKSHSHLEDHVSQFTALLRTSCAAAQATIKYHRALSPGLAHSRQDRGAHQSSQINEAAELGQH